MRVLIVLVVLIIGAAAALTMVPLKMVFDVARLDKLGLTNGGVDGTIWSGRIYDARLGRIALGDVTTHLVPQDILKGRVRIDIVGGDPTSELHGGFSAGMGGLGVDGLSMAATVPAQAPMPGGTLFIENLTARFPDGECGEASGSGRAYIPSPIAGVVPSGSLTGPVLCRDGRLTFDMASASGNEQQEIALNANGGYRLRTVIKPTNDLVARKLTSEGFVHGPDGYVFETERLL
jgi:general secretion pathway protein N